MQMTAQSKQGTKQRERCIIPIIPMVPRASRFAHFQSIALSACSNAKAAGEEAGTVMGRMCHVAWQHH